MSTPVLHLYDQDRRWVAGGHILPGLERQDALLRVSKFAESLHPDPGEPAPSVEGFHARQASPSRCGKPALYQWADRSSGIHPLPPSTLLTRSAPVFLTDARDAHLVSPPSPPG